MGLGTQPTPTVLCVQYQCAFQYRLHTIFLMFGRQARLPVDLAFQLPQNQPVCHNQYARHLQNTLRDSYKKVREQLGHNLQRQKEIYDRKAHGSSYSKGDIV